jgi:hypothetical protein
MVHDILVPVQASTRSDATKILPFDRVCIFHNRSARFVNHSSRNLTVLDDTFFLLSQKVPVHGWKSLMVMAMGRVVKRHQ